VYCVRKNVFLDANRFHIFTGMQLTKKVLQKQYYQSQD